MTIAEAIQQNPATTDQQIADLVNDSPDLYRPVPAPSVKQWMAEDGLRERLEIWLERNPVPANADLLGAEVKQLIAMRGGVKSLLGIGGQGDELVVAPGSSNRLLIDTAVATGLLPITAADLTRIMIRAKTPALLITAEQVAEVRERLGRQEIGQAMIEAAQNDFDKFANAVRNWINVGGDVPART
jgi:hypothetical protein